MSATTSGCSCPTSRCRRSRSSRTAPARRGSACVRSYSVTMVKGGQRTVLADGLDRRAVERRPTDDAELRRARGAGRVHERQQLAAGRRARVRRAAGRSVLHRPRRGVRHAQPAEPGRSTCSPASTCTRSLSSCRPGWSPTARTSSARTRARAVRSSPCAGNGKGTPVQVQRLANPLVNEAIIGTKDKDRWNATEPENEAAFLDYYTNLRLGTALQAVFGAEAKPLLDVPGLLLTYGSANDRKSELLRLNLGVAPTPLVEPAAADGAGRRQRRLAQRPAADRRRDRHRGQGHRRNELRERVGRRRRQRQAVSGGVPVPALAARRPRPGAPARTVDARPNRSRSLWTTPQRRCPHLRRGRVCAVVVALVALVARGSGDGGKRERSPARQLHRQPLRGDRALGRTRLRPLRRSTLPRCPPSRKAARCGRPAMPGGWRRGSCSRSTAVASRSSRSTAGLASRPGAGGLKTFRLDAIFVGAGTGTRLGLPRHELRAANRLAGGDPHGPRRRTSRVVERPPRERERRGSARTRRTSSGRRST